MNYKQLNSHPREGYGYIYKYISPSNKIYIGQTKYSIKERARKNGVGYKNCSIFYSAIKKYGIENFICEIIEECPVEFLNERETYYIHKLDTLFPNGYNIKENENEKSFSKKRVKIDVYSTECVFEKSFDSMIDASKYYCVPWQAISSCVRGEIQYYKDKIYVLHGEHPKKPRIIKTHGRMVVMIDDEGNTIKTFNSANEAARFLGKPSSIGRNIRQVCEGKRHKAINYSWKFLD